MSIVSKEEGQSQVDILEVMEKFPAQQACISHIEEVRWGDTPRGPQCDGTHVGRRKEIAEGRLGLWNCHDCKVTYKVVYTASKEVGKKIDHKVINHSEQFVDGETHTNTIEGFSSLLKRA